MSVLCCLILLGFLWKCRINRFGLIRDCLSLENTKAIRGILSVLVVCYHLAQRTGGTRSLFHVFVFFGFLPVAYFFFLSGYGLQKSFMGKENYRSTILPKRIPSVALPYLGFVLLYWRLSWVEGDPYSPGEVLVSLINGDPIVSFSWYIECILLLYLVYYISTVRHFGNSLAIPAVNLLLILLLTAAFRKLGIGTYWYSTYITYPLGILWAAKERELTAWIGKRYYLLLPVCAAGFGALFVATLVYSEGFVNLWLYWPCCLMFVVTFLLIQMKITFKNRLLLALGQCSMEIYMFHGFFMKLYRGSHIYLEEPLLWCIAVLLSTVAVSLAVHGIRNSSKRK